MQRIFERLGKLPWSEFLVPKINFPPSSRIGVSRAPKVDADVLERGPDGGSFLGFQHNSHIL